VHNTLLAKGDVKGRFTCKKKKQQKTKKKTKKKKKNKKNFIKFF